MFLCRHHFKGYQVGNVLNWVRSTWPLFICCTCLPQWIVIVAADPVLLVLSTAFGARGGTDAFLMRSRVSYLFISPWNAPSPSPIFTMPHIRTVRNCVDVSFPFLSSYTVKAFFISRFLSHCWPKTCHASLVDLESLDMLGVICPTQGTQKSFGGGWWRTQPT